MRGTGSFLSGPGSCGPVLVARSRWPGPGPVPVAQSRWPGPGGPVPLVSVAAAVFAVARWPGPGPGPVLAVCPAHGLVLVARWPGPGPGLPVCFGGGGPVPVPVLGPAPSRWPSPSPNKADHLCSSVASFTVSRHGGAISSRNMVALRCSPNHW